MLFIHEKGRKFLVLRCKWCGRIRKRGEWVDPTPEMEKELNDNALNVHVVSHECNGCKGGSK
jgi:hypothetical protein